MAFNKNYLPAQSQLWAREVQKRIENTETAFRSAEVNNTTRDDQLASSFRQVQTAANDAKEAADTALTASETALSAISGLTGLGEPGSEYDVNGANLVVGSVTATQIDADYVYAGSISANQIDAGTLSANFISGGTIDASDISGVNITGTNISGGTIDGAYITGVIIETGGEVSAAEVNCAVLYANQTIEANGGYLGTVNTTIANNTTASFAGNVFINTSGNMFRSTTTSSREAKENIQAYSFDTDAFISVDPVTFNYKKEAVLNEEEADINQLGFILEDFEDAGVAEHLVIPANEMDQYKGLRYDKLYMMLHKVVQEQDKTIKALEARVADLEDKVK